MSCRESAGISASGIANLVHMFDGCSPGLGHKAWVFFPLFPKGLATKNALLSKSTAVRTACKLRPLKAFIVPISQHVLQVKALRCSLWVLEVAFCWLWSGWRSFYPHLPNSNGQRPVRRSEKHSYLGRDCFGEWIHQVICGCAELLLLLMLIAQPPPSSPVRFPLVWDPAHWL